MSEEKKDIITVQWHANEIKLMVDALQFSHSTLAYLINCHKGPPTEELFAHQKKLEHVTDQIIKLLRLLEIGEPENKLPQ